MSEAKYTKISDAMKKIHRDKKWLTKREKRLKIFYEFMILALILVAVFVIGVSLGMRKEYTGKISAAVQRMDALEQKLSLFADTYENKVFLYDIIDREAKMLDKKTNKIVSTMTSAQKRKLCEMMLDALKQYGQRGQNLAMFCSIIKTESNWQFDITSSSGARGLMQVVDPTMKAMCDELVLLGETHLAWKGPQDSYDMERNFKAAVHFIDKVHQFNVAMGYERMDEIGWRTYYEYNNGGESLRRIVAAQPNINGESLRYPKIVFEAISYYKQAGL